ncbi:hypothetical protein BDZ89DRAFT_234857 [Hymenopellis radicata]|nr:hypothetical protein BDZ89DRAFT_234857 [Hymenopellis radicata]
MQNQGGQFFSAASSPPLVLAFLSIGLFGAGMIGVFGWRRLQLGMVGGRGTDIGPPSKERPKLWDLWSDKAIYSRDSNTMNWRNMMPVSAMTINDNVPLSLSPSSSSRGPPTFREWVSQCLSHFRDGLVGHTRDGSRAEQGKGQEENMRLQLIVAIALPSESRWRQKRSSTLSSCSAAEKSDAVEYALGIRHLPWSEAG